VNAKYVPHMKLFPIAKWILIVQTFTLILASECPINSLGSSLGMIATSTETPLTRASSGHEEKWPIAHPARITAT
jgi:hypothetical protein